MSAVQRWPQPHNERNIPLNEPIDGLCSVFGFGVGGYPPFAASIILLFICTKSNLSNLVNKNFRYHIQLRINCPEREVKGAWNRGDNKK